MFTSAKIIGELHALVMRLLSMQFWPDYFRLTLWLSAGFISLTSYHPILVNKNQLTSQLSMNVNLKSTQVQCYAQYALYSKPDSDLCYAAPSVIQVPLTVPEGLGGVK